MKPVPELMVNLVPAVGLDLGLRTYSIKREKAPHRRPYSYDRVRGFSHNLFGGVLLSHRVPPAVPSALKGLASGFGM